MTSQSSEPGPLLTPKAVASRLGVDRRTLFRWVATGRFPAPIRYSRKTVRWPRDVVEKHAEAQAG